MIFDIIDDHCNCIKLSIFNPLHPTINIHIRHTAFSTVHGTDEENLVGDQELLKLAIIFLSLRNLYILFKDDPVRRIQRPVTLWLESLHSP